jgi:hypothetical protein
LKYKKLLSVALLAVLHSASTIASASSPVIYSINVDSYNPRLAKVKIDTSTLPSITMLASRTMRNNRQPELICQRGGLPDRRVDFGSSINCDSVVWTLNFQKEVIEGVDASLQNNIYSPAGDWHLLTEWNSLPRIKGMNNVQVCINSDKPQCHKLPSISSPPLFMVWGMAEKELNIDDVPVHVMTNQTQLLEQNSTWLPILSNQISYIKSVFNVDKMEPWSLVWLKREVSSGSIGGAAGNQIYIANVATKNGILISTSYQHLLKISAHESIHFLSSVPAPAWADESLAEYYAIKSLSKTVYSLPDPIETWQRMAAKFPHGETNLYEASRFVTEEQNYEYYGLFYTKGPAFWAELDKQLHLKGDSLTPYLSELKTEWKVNLPPQFVDAMIKIIGAKDWVRIENKYL